MQNYTFLEPSILLKLQIKNDDKQHCIQIFIFSGFIYTLNINFPTVCSQLTKNATHLMCNKQVARTHTLFKYCFQISSYGYMQNYKTERIFMLVERSYIQNKHRTASVLHLNCEWPHQILQ